MKTFDRVSATLSYLKKKARSNNSNSLQIVLEISATECGVSTIELREHLNILNILGSISLGNASPDSRGQTRTLEVLCNA
jgi:hypothetical protein